MTDPRGKGAMQDQPLVVEQIHKTFTSGFRRRRIKVLEGVSMHLNQGEIFTLLGPNGAGKTTLMKIVLGLVRPTSGGGRLLGRPLGDLGARRQIGFQPEQPYLYPALTVQETLDLMAGLSGVPRVARRTRIGAVVERCSLQRHLRTQVRKLSRGWLQRLTFAGALLPDPQLLLLDEPLGGLDPEARLALKGLILDLRAAGKTIMFNSHILPDVEALADRIALLRQGKIIAAGRLDELLDRAAEGAEIEVQGAGLTLPAPCRLVWERAASGRAGWWVPGEDPGRLQRILRDIVTAGAVVHAVVPRRQALEAFFAQAMEAAGREDLLKASRDAEIKAAS